MMEAKTLLLEKEFGILTVYFNRPKARNALSLQMVEELEEVLKEAESDDSVRAIVLRGSGKHFCAGGDIKDMATARMKPSGDVDPIAELNRRFGTLITKFNACLKTVVVVVQGAAMGGGFGLVCVADIVLADESAKFKLPETSLGVPPAQIAPFLVYRIGLAKARRFALTGASLKAQQAYEQGLVDILVNDDDELEAALDELRAQIRKCAPKASQQTKKILLAVGTMDHEVLLDWGAEQFSQAIRKGEGMEGMMAFMQRRKAKWAVES
ncbi:MAG: enoyl-CoA hydratase/isomerase family protein [Myxococcota bacterium]|nr:enoyl-CoA hydratase/isomerase family protein [Myxococcota bacterium]